MQEQTIPVCVTCGKGIEREPDERGIISHVLDNAGAHHWECWGRNPVIERITELETALRVVVGHWDEFGSEHDFAETIEIARSLVR